MPSRYPAAMSPPPRRRARRRARLAGLAGGALASAGALTAGILAGQAALARRTIPIAQAPPPRCDGEYGAAYAGAPPLRLGVLGDSTAAGYGVAARAETPGAHLAGWLAEATHRPVRLTCPAVVGAISAWLVPQVEAVTEAGVDLAVIFVGANDVTARVAEAAAVRHLFEAVRALRTAGAEVVVATCPDLGTIRPIRPPLRWLARRWSRRLATAQTIAVVEAGGRSVSLGDLLGPQFDAAPERLFGLDRYHPSADGYRLAAAAVLPTALAALGLPAPHGPTPATVRSLPAAAAAAARRPGTEVSGAAVAGLERGPAGRWAQLSRRVRIRPRSLAPGPDDAVPSLAGPESRAEPSAESAVETP